MARKKPTQTYAQPAVEQDVTETTDTESQTDSAVEEDNDATIVTPSEPGAESSNDEYEILIERGGEAPKLSPKSTGLIYFQMARSTADQKLYIRIQRQDGGGLHSKEWIAIEAIIDRLRNHADQAFKSGILKPLFKSGSANNVSFLAAILRSEPIGLIIANPQSQFQHLLAPDFESKAQALLDKPSA